ncbi:hypothetical protein L228DRAFT_80173 [Xylona heveae TC161]|uniref:Voltage-gated hydrogen channel 1 n=1 Tax=Xylona heveae (strain CBS 132557 / TC161) TaxID=1328760 RepID=A0A165J1V2_XYLHT|nr:hypothetical protein L228DRAFT_80173 [Xylona heveae TC161]KZF25626.1 hypothetical protein L228DRAFT_80173 [Xylona heveae TC161]
MSNDYTQPLLREDQRALAHAAHDRIHRFLHVGGSSSSNNDNDGGGEEDATIYSKLHRGRRHLQRFLTSKTGHYSVLLLVVLDVSCIMADFVINLFMCERKHPGHGWAIALEALGITSLVFSCLFMLELMASVCAFGFGYFNSWFHCFDATVIVAGFVIDVLLRGVVEEVASLVIVLRLWRVFKIMEELSVGAQEQMEELVERLEKLEQENRELRKEINAMKSDAARGSNDRG